MTELFFAIQQALGTSTVRVDPLRKSLTSSWNPPYLLARRLDGQRKMNVHNDTQLVFYAPDAPSSN